MITSAATAVGIRIDIDLRMFIPGGVPGIDPRSMRQAMKMPSKEIGGNLAGRRGIRGSDRSGTARDLSPGVDTRGIGLGQPDARERLSRRRPRVAFRDRARAIGRLGAACRHGPSSPPEWKACSVAGGRYDWPSSTAGRQVKHSRRTRNRGLRGRDSGPPGIWRPPPVASYLFWTFEAASGRHLRTSAGYNHSRRRGSRERRRGFSIQGN